MKQSLKTLFKQYGRVLDVVAHKSIRMRGQAFVTLDSKDAAVKAVKEVQAFPLYGKPMVRRSFTTRGDRKRFHPALNSALPAASGVRKDTVGRARQGAATGRV